MSGSTAAAPMATPIMVGDILRCSAHSGTTTFSIMLTELAVSPVA